MQVYKHLGIYVYRKDALLKMAALKQTGLELSESLEQLRALENGMAIKVVETPLYLRSGGYSGRPRQGQETGGRFVGGQD